MELSGVSPFFSRSEILSHEAVLSNLHRKLKRRWLIQGVCPAVSPFALNAPNGCQPPAATGAPVRRCAPRTQPVHRLGLVSGPAPPTARRACPPPAATGAPVRRCAPRTQPVHRLGLVSGPAPPTVRPVPNRRC